MKNGVFSGIKKTRLININYKTAIPKGTGFIGLEFTTDRYQFFLNVGFSIVGFIGFSIFQYTENIEANSIFWYNRITPNDYWIFNGSVMVYLRLSNLYRTPDNSW